MLEQRSQPSLPVGESQGWVVSRTVLWLHLLPFLCPFMLPAAWNVGGTAWDHEEEGHSWGRQRGELGSLGPQDSVDRFSLHSAYVREK